MEDPRLDPDYEPIPSVVYFDDDSLNAYLNYCDMQEEEERLNRLEAARVKAWGGKL